MKLNPGCNTRWNRSFAILKLNSIKRSPITPVSSTRNLILQEKATKKRNAVGSNELLASLESLLASASHFRFSTGNLSSVPRFTTISTPAAGCSPCSQLANPTRFRDPSFNSLLCLPWKFARPSRWHSRHDSLLYSLSFSHSWPVPSFFKRNAAGIFARFPCEKLHRAARRMAAAKLPSPSRLKLPGRVARWIKVTKEERLTFREGVINNGMKKAEGEEGKVSVQVSSEEERSHHLFSLNRFNFGTRHFRESIRGNRGRDLHATLCRKNRGRNSRRETSSERKLRGGRTGESRRIK